MTVSAFFAFLCSLSAQTGGSTQWIDRAIDPTTDFYQFANGGWLKATVLPPDRPSISNFDTLELKNREVLRKIVEEAANDPSLRPDTVRGKVGIFYRVAMDEARAKRQGLNPLAPELRKIASIHDSKSLAETFAHLSRIGVIVGFNSGVKTDPRDSTKTMLAVAQGGLGLGDRDLYMAADQRSEQIRSIYRSVIERSFTLSGETGPEAVTHTGQVMAIETRLARAASTRTELRDVKANIHLMDLKDLQQLSPAFDWQTFWRGCGQPRVTQLNVGQPKYFAELDRALASEPIESWRSYLKFRLLQEASPYLEPRFFENTFRLTSARFGVEKLPARWEVVTENLDDALGEAVGQLYIQKAFSAEAKAKALSLFSGIRAVLRERIQASEWMSDATKAKALKKLDAMRAKIGYPEAWKDYSNLKIEDDSYVQNIFRIGEWGFHRMMSRLKRPANRLEWNLTPATVNASYSNSRNEIVVPAGILQPPFFSPEASDAANYGGIGMVIAHEITHAFDDQGRRFDEQGNLSDWWSADDARNFDSISQRLVAQFNRYEIEPGQPVNGTLTLGENLADLGGLQLAYLAFQRSSKGKNLAVENRFTNDQHFFLRFAQVWQEKSTPEFGRSMLRLNPHAPGRFRVNGVLQNTPQFWEAWGKKAPLNAVRLW